MRIAAPTTFLALLFPCIAVGQWTGGPVIISGFDIEEHDVYFETTAQQEDAREDPINWTGLLYVRQGFDFIRGNIDLDVVRGKEIVACLGCNGGFTSRVFEIAFDASFLRTQLGWQRVTITGHVGDDSIAGFFAGSHPTTNLQDVGVIYLPSIISQIFDNSGITDAELAVLATPTNRKAIRDFVMTGKGGLFSHTHENEGGFDWLTLSNGLMENLNVLDCDGTCDDEMLALTNPDGRNAFPNLFRNAPIVKWANQTTLEGAFLKEAIAGATEWHNHFENFDNVAIPAGVTVLAEDPDQRAVILAAPEPVAPCSGNADPVFPRFDDRQDFLTGSGFVAVAVADFDGDDFPDVATTNAPNGTVIILLNNGNDMSGDWQGLDDQSPQTISVSPQIGIVGPSKIITLDVDDDSDLDLALIYRRFDTADANILSILLNDGTGTFAEASSQGSPFTVGNAPEGLAAADFDNADGIDIAVSNSVDNSITILLNDGTTGGTWDGFKSSVLTETFPPLSEPIGIFAADFIAGNGPDIAVVLQDANQISFLENKGVTTTWQEFEPSVEFATRESPFALTGGDFDGDGTIDLVPGFFIRTNSSALPNTWQIHFNNDDRTFKVGPTGLSHILSGRSVVRVDIDGDGDSDLAVGEASFGNGHQFVSVYLNVNGSTFRHGASVSVFNNEFSDIFSVATGDLDDDGDEDLVAPEFGSGVSVFLQTDATIAEDCNDNGVDDTCDIADGISIDFDTDGVPDECQGIDSDGDRIIDSLDTPCPCDYNPVHEDPFDCDADGTIGGVGSGEAAGEQCDFCSCKTPDTSCLP